MSLAFHRTLRALERERREQRPLLLCAGLALLGAWSAWMVAARVPVYALSTSGRLEVSATTHRAASPTSGRIAAVLARLGQEVAADQPLVKLDDGLERRRLEEALAELAALAPRLDALEAQLAAEERVRAWQARASGAAASERSVTLAEAGREASYRARLLEISASLRREALISELDALQAEQDVSRSRLELTAAEVGLARQRVDSRYADEVQAARLAGLRRQAADLEAQRLAAEAAVATARAELDRRTLRAPIAGSVGSLAPVRIGDVTREGEVVATIIPHVRVRVVADFAPSEALGRVRPGQRARVRLSGFSVVERGTLEAIVSQVASEPQRGSVRVELALAENRGTRLPVQHGLPGTVEVRVEEATPLSLLVRSLGRALDAPTEGVTLAAEPPARAGGAG